MFVPHAKDPTTSLQDWFPPPIPPGYNRGMIIGDDKSRDLDANYPEIGCLLRALIIGSAFAIAVGIALFIVYGWYLDIVG
jgi:hypothetical protein